MPNYNPETGIRYGVVALGSLSEWAFDEFFHNGRNLTYEAALSEAKAEHDGEWDDAAEQDFADSYECDCEQYELETTDDDGNPLKLGLSCLGGAPLVWVFESAYQCDCAQCSPCVPGAGDLDTRRDPSGVGTYDLPPNWYETLA